MRYRTIYPRWLLYTFGLLCCISAQGQTGPFGIGNATGADGQPRLLVWLDGSTPAVAPGNDVVLWPDKSGNGNDFTAVSASSPVLTSGNATINNRPFLTFNKTNNRMVLNNLTLTDGAISIFYVFRTADANFGMLSMATSDANPRQVLVHQQGGQTRFTVAGNEFITSIGGLSNNEWRYAGFIWEAGTNPTYWHRSSGTGAPELEQTNVLTTENAAATGTAVIGHIQSLLNGGYTTDESFQGELAELIVYDGRVNRAMLRQINTYFRNKYNVGGTGSWDKLGAPVGFREGLIGIARDNGSNSEHRYSRADGLVLRANAGGIQGTFAYLSAGHSGIANSVVTTELPASVDARWARNWYVKKDGLANASDIQMAFDFGEGINGEFPANADGYVLLFRSGTTGNYAVQAVTEKYILDKEVVFRVSGAQIQGAGYYTLGTTNNVTSNLTGQTIRAWYAFQSGNWSNPLTWTLDGSAAPTYINPSGSIPAVNDAVVIASGRTVQCDLNNRIQTSLSLFGTLDVGTSTGHNMNTISGNGTLRCAGAGGISNFPAGNTAAFANELTGGLTEFYGSGFTQNQNLLLNRLRINMTAETSTVTLAANLTHNGFFEIVRGTLEVNNTAVTVRSIESFGDVLVETQGRVRASATNVSHQWTFHKDFVNEGGDVRMTNRVAPNYTSAENQGHIRARFVSAVANQRLVANGTTYLSRLVVNKGSNATYVLTVTSDGPGKFALHGPANSGMAEQEYLDENSASQTNSVALVNGTLEVRENIFLPLQTGAGNYNINATAALWINGGFAAKGAPDVGTGNATAIVPYGLIRVSAGTLNANCQSGITTRGNGVLQVDGGEVNANQIRTSIFGDSNQGGVVINGGVVNVDGTRPGAMEGTYYTFSLTYTGNLFRMTGGQLLVSGPSARGLIFINSDPQNTSVSGGTVVAISKTTTGGVHRITSRAAFWNFEVRRTVVTGANLPITVSGGDSFGQLIGNLPLSVRNNLVITGQNAATLRMRSVDNVALDAFIEGNMTVENGGVYDHQTNTTRFVGGSNSILNLPLGSTFFVHTLVVNKNSETRFAEIQTGNATNALEVQGQLRIERGGLNNNNLHVRALGRVENRGIIGTELGTGVLRLEGSTSQEVFSDNGIFHNLTLNNAAGAVLANGEARVRRTMTLQNGNFNLQSFKLRIETATGEVSVASPSATRCFVTGGNPSDGGLEVIFKSAAQETTFPMGVNDGGIKYVPAVVGINNDFVDEGYIRIVPVKGPLPTTNFSAVSDYLAFYWKVVHSEFGVLPRVSHRFEYDNSQIVGNANNFSAGRVLFDAPFERQSDQLPVTPAHVDVPNRFIYYNGTDAAQNMAGNGILLTNASYTAGHENMFVGKPKVFYSRNAALNADFNLAANWNELGQFSSGDDVFDYHSSAITGNLEFPQAGDIAFIGFDPLTGRPHSYQAVSAVTASEVRFTPMQNASFERLPRWNGPAAADITVRRPTFSFSTDAQITNIVSISGEGTLLMRDNVDLRLIDIGNFLAEDSSIVMVESAVAAFGGLEITTLPAQVPNLFVTSTNNGSDTHGVRFRSNTQVRGNLEVAGRAKLIMNDATAGNITVDGMLRLDRYQATSSSPEVLFPNASVTPRTLTVKGNLIVKGSGAQIRVDAANASPQLVHRLVVHGDILQNAPSSTALNLFTDAASDYIALTLTGTGNHSFQNDGGNAPQLGSLIVDKGSNRTSGFTFNSLINVGAAADGAEKPVLLRNGLLTLNNSSIDITLSSGGANFNIPESSGLALQQGTLRINGSEVGLNLAGLLRINAGLFELGNTAGVNNYLEYSVGGTAILEVFGGQLNVGSQLRRGLTSTEGVLNYRQTGGFVRVGIHAAPTGSRGVFEVLNTGSNFEFTGGELVIVRGINSTAVPSLRLEPYTSSVGPSGFVRIGNAASPSGASVKNIGIQSSVALPSLTVNNASGNGPVAKLYGLPLTIQQELIITSGSTFDSQFLTLTVQGDIDNEGVLKSDNGTLVLNHSSFNAVSGNGVFDLNNLTRSGGGVTDVASNLLVKGNFSHDTGIIQAGIQTLTLRGNAIVDGEIQFSAGEGMILSGSPGQQLRRTGPGTSQIDILTTDNPAGIQQPASQGYIFQIGNALRLRRGIFNLNGNLLELGANANIVAVNAFGQNNMITTGGSFTNFGLRKTFAVNTQQDFFAPLGLDKYMPMRLVFSDIGFSSGSTVSSYLFRLVQPGHPVLLDAANALQMYFSITAEGVGSGLRMDAEMTYDDSYVAVTAPNTVADYIGARVVDGSPVPSVFKFFDAVNPTQRLLVFNFNNVTADGISGDYFAGIDAAIPDIVPVYTTVRDGNVNEGDAIGGAYDIGVPGGGAPNGAVVHIVNDHELNLNINGVTLYKTIIDEGAVLNINNTSFHRLGIVEGTGTIRLNNTGSLPSGLYNQFFTCTGGRLEYAGNASYEILAGIPIVRSVRLSGSGSRILANNDLFVCEDVIVNGPNFQNANLVNVTVGGDLSIGAGEFNNGQGTLNLEGNLSVTNGTFTSGNIGTRTIEGDILQSGGAIQTGTGGVLRLRGDYLKSGGTFSGTATSKVELAGTSQQVLSGNFSGTDALRVLEINNAEGVKIHNNIDLAIRLDLTLGHVYTAPDSVLRLGTAATVVPPRGRPTSFVHGPLDWVNLATTGGERIFPVGKGQWHRPLTLANRSAQRTWTVEYYDTTATTHSGITNLLPDDPFVIKTVSKQEYWRVNSNIALATNALVGLSWGDGSVVAPLPGDYDKLVVLKWDGPAEEWQSAGANSSSFNFEALTQTGNFLSASATSFTERFFTLGSTDAVNPLPVSFLHFTGTTDGRQHRLAWATASEVNNDYFELERSADGINFIAIARVEGAGNSNTRINYHFTDQAPPQGRAYYRLRQVDFDGAFAYANEIVTLVRTDVSAQKLDFLIYPNPTTDGSARLMMPDLAGQLVLVAITDLSGRTVWRKTVWVDEQGTSEPLDCNFRAGVYIVSVLHDNAMRSKPLVISQ